MQVLSCLAELQLPTRAQVNTVYWLLQLWPRKNIPFEKWRGRPSFVASRTKSAHSIYCRRGLWRRRRCRQRTWTGERGRRATRRKRGDFSTTSEEETFEIRNSALHHEGQTHCVIKIPLLQGVEVVRCKNIDRSKGHTKLSTRGFGSRQIRDNHHHHQITLSLNPYRRRKYMLCLIQNNLQMAVPIKRKINCTLS